MKFCGWVPTVTGHLSFTTIGKASHPSKTKELRSNDATCVIQTRDLLDVLLPYLDKGVVGSFFREKISNYLIGISGKFSFICIGQTSNDRESFGGCVFVVADATERKKIRELKRQFKHNEEHAFIEKKKVIERLANSICIAEGKFSLERSGKLTLNCIVKSEYHESNSAINRVLANQIFYFLKDMAHVHQHHDPSYDAITELSDIKEDDPDLWMKETQRSLYRAVIRYKRYRNEKALFRASGILAYARSFERTQGVSRSDAGLTDFNDEELANSLAVSRDEIKHFDQKRLASMEATRNIFFALFGFVISATFLARQAEGFSLSPHPAIIWATQAIAEKPFHLVGLVVLISFTYSFLTHRVDPAEIRFVRFTMAALQGFRLRWNTVFNVIATALFSWLCYLFLIADFF